MFGPFFKRDRQEYTPSFEETNNPSQIDLPKMTSPKEDNSPVYQVGRTLDNRITLRIGDNYSHSTLIMNEEGVRRLIRLLEATLLEDEDVISQSENSESVE